MKRALFSAMTIMMVSAPLAAQQQGVPMSPSQMFLKQFDTDNNGMVSKQEFLKPQEVQFDHMDSNKDGSVSAAEVETFVQQMRQRMMQMQKQMQKQMPKQ